MTRGLTLLTENTWCNLAVRILKKENIFGRKEKNQRTNTSSQITPTSNLCSLKETVHSFTQSASSQKKKKENVFRVTSNYKTEPRRKVILKLF